MIKSVSTISRRALAPVAIVSRQALIALAIMISCCGCEPPSPSTREDYSAHAAVTLGQSSIDSAPSPSPSPSDGKCKNCKGVGKVGDGRTMLTCDVCKGTGKETKGSVIEPIKQVVEPIKQVTEPIKPVTKPMAAIDPEANVIPTLPFKRIEQPKSDVIKPTIIVWTQANCPPCDKWKVSEAPLFRKAGWTIIEQLSTSGLTPRFEVMDSKRKFAYTGYMTVAQFNAKYFADQPSSWVPRDGKRPSDMPPKRQDGREFDGGPEFGNGSWAQRDEDGIWRRNGG